MVVVVACQAGNMAGLCVDIDVRCEECVMCDDERCKRWVCTATWAVETRIGLSAARVVEGGCSM